MHVNVPSSELVHRWLRTARYAEAVMARSESSESVIARSESSESVMSQSESSESVSLALHRQVRPTAGEPRIFSES